MPATPPPELMGEVAGASIRLREVALPVTGEYEQPGASTLLNDIHAAEAYSNRWLACPF